MPKKNVPLLDCLRMYMKGSNLLMFSEKMKLFQFVIDPNWTGSLSSPIPGLPVLCPRFAPTIRGRFDHRPRSSSKRQPKPKIAWTSVHVRMPIGLSMQISTQCLLT